MLLAAALACGERSALLEECGEAESPQCQPHGPDKREAREAGCGSGQGDGDHGGAAGGGSDSLAEWRRQRSRVEPHAPGGRDAWEAGGAGGGSEVSELARGGAGGGAEMRSVHLSSIEDARDVRGTADESWDFLPRDRPCGRGEHSDGRWVPKTAGEMEGAMEAAHSRCYWVNESLIGAGRSEFLVQCGGNGCNCKGWVDHFAWEPARCALSTWDAGAFCDALRGRSLLFIGDSTMMQAGAAVINEVRWDQGDGPGCLSQLSLGLSDTLLGVPLGVGNRGRDWTSWVAGFARGGGTGKSRVGVDGQIDGQIPPGGEPDIVVVSAGAHVSLLTDFEFLIDRVLDQHQTLFPEVKLVWQTQPGAGCGPSPLEEPPDEAFWARQNKSYNWPLFEAFDAVARTRFTHPAAASENRFLLDVSPLGFRVDAHPGSRGNVSRDCLHACLPGPLDHLVPRTLLHLLLHHGL